MTITAEFIKMLKKADKIAVGIEFGLNSEGKRQGCGKVDITLFKKVKTEFADTEMRKEFNGFVGYFDNWGKLEYPRSAFFHTTNYSFNGEGFGTWGALAMILREGDELKFRCYDNLSPAMYDQGVHEDVLTCSIARKDKDILRDFPVCTEVVTSALCRKFKW